LRKCSTPADHALRGALIGGPITGVAGFITGIVVVITYRLPIPPLLTFEAGCLVGATVGASIGLIVAWRLTRCVFYSLLATAAIIAMCVLLVHCAFSWANIQRLLLVGVIVGLNAALISRHKAGAQP
jgi:hypothetical protein